MNIDICIPWRHEASRADGFNEVYKQWRIGETVIIRDSDPDESFNRSQARNRCASVSRADVLVFADACIRIDPNIIYPAAEIAAQGNLVHCFTTLTYLDANGKQIRSRSRSLPGGVVAVSRFLFEDVGGYDERFLHWGGEDNAFAWACGTLGDRRVVVGDAYHLWHDKTERKARLHSEPLLGQYIDARGNKDAMRELIQNR